MLQLLHTKLQLTRVNTSSKSDLTQQLQTNTKKVSYSCLPNIKTEISRHNKKVLTSADNLPPSCNCRDKSSCPLPGKCSITNVVYQATVNRRDQGTSTTYIGLASQFESRWQSHKTSFRHEKYRSSTKISTYIWSLQDQNVPYNITWDIMGRASSYNQASNKYRLCLLEKFVYFLSPREGRIKH